MIPPLVRVTYYDHLAAGVLEEAIPGQKMNEGRILRREKTVDGQEFLILAHGVDHDAQGDDQLDNPYSIIITADIISIENLPDKEINWVAPKK